MFSKRFVDRGPVKTYNTYIYIYTYIHISKERLEWLGKCVQTVEDLLFFKPSPVGNARNVDMKWFLHRMAEKADVEQNAQTVGKWQFSITAVRIVVLPLKWGNEKSHQLWNTFQGWWDFILYPSGISDYLLTGAALICTIGITTGNEESLWKGRMKLHVAEIKNKPNEMSLQICKNRRLFRRCLICFPDECTGGSSLFYNRFLLSISLVAVEYRGIQVVCWNI